MQVQILRTPKQEEVSQLKTAIKASGIPASVRIQKNIKRVYGSVSVQPTKSIKRSWSEDQTLAMIELVKSHGFNVREYEYNSLVYQQGLTYLMVTE